MMKNILLPTDFSENSWNAIKYGVNFFESENCNFYLLHVNRLVDTVFDDSIPISNQHILEDVNVKPSKQALLKILKRISIEIPTNKKHKFFSLTDYNFFIESIRKHVEEKNIDIIVMGTKGASGLDKIIIGSNTSDVFTKVKCPTLAIPEKARFDKIEQIAFPTDFSLYYDIQILEPLFEILENYNSNLNILYISKNNSSLNSDQIRNKELMDDYFNHLSHNFHYLTNKKIEDAIQTFIRDNDINLICMVAKNLNYFQQILFHSKVKEIGYHTKTPFLVLHHKN